MTTEQAWTLYKQSQDPAAREKLVTAYTPLIHFVLGQIHLPLSPLLQMEDAISYGLIGLLDAIEKYDPARGFKFETYAVARIRGAIRDGVRETQWMPRSVQEKSTQVERALRRLEVELGRTPMEEEVADALGMSLKAYQAMMSEISPITLLSLDDIIFESHDGEAITLQETVADQSGTDPHAVVEWEEYKRLLAEAIETLPDREKLVVALYVYEELTLKEIGEVLGISGSRVCQLYTQALLRLRARLAPYDEERSNSNDAKPRAKTVGRPKKAVPVAAQPPKEVVTYDDGNNGAALAADPRRSHRKGPASPTAPAAAGASATRAHGVGTKHAKKQGVISTTI